MAVINTTNINNQKISPLRELYDRQQINKKKNIKESIIEQDKKHQQRLEDKKYENKKRSRVQDRKTGRSNIDIFA